MIAQTQIEEAAIKLRELAIAITFVEVDPLGAVERTMDVLSATGIIPEDLKEKIRSFIETTNRIEETKELERFLG